MNPALPRHSSVIQSLMAQMDDDRAAIFRVFDDLIGPGSQVFPLDTWAIGAAKRATSSTSAFKLLIESWNMTTARTLLRTHIDTMLRFSAAWLVEDPHKFLMEVIGGKEVRKIKDRNGKLMSDAYLVDALTPRLPWLRDVYKELSGYIHFSGSHVFASISSMQGHGKVSFLISELDLDYPEESWVEVVDCFRESTAVLLDYLRGYAVAKHLTPTQLANGRKN